MNVTKTRLADFGADQLFIVSTGQSAGFMIDLTDPDGFDSNQVGFALNTPPWDLAGTVDGSVWEWDGQGHLRDYNGNTITALRAYLPQESR